MSMKQVLRKSKYLIFILFILHCSFYYSCSSEDMKVQFVPLNELNNPLELYANQGHLYITDCADEEQRCTSVHVYSLKDYSLLLKLGGDGDEPGKYTMQIGHSVYVDFPPNKIFINDYSKIGFYTHDGRFINERNTEKNSTIYRAVGNNFIAQGSINEDSLLYYTVNLYNADLERTKEIYRIENPYNPITKKNRVYTRKLFFQSYKNAIYIKGFSEDFVIDVFDSLGIRINTIQLPYTREKVIEHHRAKVYEMYKNHPLFGKYYDIIKDEIVFPEYLPAINNFRIADDEIYIPTYRRKEDKTEFYILDLNGKFLKRVFVPFNWYSSSYPRYAVANRKIYQLTKNKITNKWDLIIIQII